MDTDFYKLIHPLDGPLLRISVAHEHIASLKSAIHSVCHIQKNPLRVKLDTNKRENIIRAKNVPLVDPVWGVFVGEVLHNLRSALDNLVWQVAKLNVPDLAAAYGTKTPRMQFPIFMHPHPLKGGGDSKCFHGVGIKTHLEFVDPKHRSMFEAQQPYFGKNGRERDPLWVLKHLNDIDKHQIIQPVSLLGRRSRIVPGGGGAQPRSVKMSSDLRTGQEVVEDAVIGRVWDIEVSDPSVELYFEHTFDVCFDKSCGPAAGAQVLHQLSEMRGRVSYIVDTFEPLFAHITGPRRFPGPPGPSDPPERPEPLV